MQQITDFKELMDLPEGYLLRVTHKESGSSGRVAIGHAKGEHYAKRQVYFLSDWLEGAGWGVKNNFNFKHAWIVNMDTFREFENITNTGESLTSANSDEPRPYMPKPFEICRMFSNGHWYTGMFIAHYPGNTADEKLFGVTGVDIENFKLRQSANGMFFMEAKQVLHVTKNSVLQMLSEKLQVPEDCIEITD